MPPPTGMLSLPINNLRRSIANSSAFQAAVGATDIATALPFVHAFGVFGTDLDAAFYASVDWAPGFAREIHAKGTNNFFNTVAELQILFHQQITSPAEIDAAFDFSNLLGAIMSDMEEVAGTATFLDIQALRVAEGPYRPEEDEATTERGGDFYELLLDVEFASV